MTTQTQNTQPVKNIEQCFDPKERAQIRDQLISKDGLKEVTHTYNAQKINGQADKFPVPLQRVIVDNMDRENTGKGNLTSYNYIASSISHTCPQRMKGPEHHKTADCSIKVTWDLQKDQMKADIQPPRQYDKHITPPILTIKEHLGKDTPDKISEKNMQLPKNMLCMGNTDLLSTKTIGVMGPHDAKANGQDIMKSCVEQSVGKDYTLVTTHEAPPPMDMQGNRIEHPNKTLSVANKEGGNIILVLTKEGIDEYAKSENAKNLDYDRTLVIGLATSQRDITSDRDSKELHKTVAGLSDAVIISDAKDYVKYNNAQMDHTNQSHAIEAAIESKTPIHVLHFNTPPHGIATGAIKNNLELLSRSETPNPAITKQMEQSYIDPGNAQKGDIQPLRMSSLNGLPNMNAVFNGIEKQAQREVQSTPKTMSHNTPTPQQETTKTPQVEMER